MEMESLVNLIVNSSVSIIVIAFFMYRDIKFMSQLQTTLQTLVDVVDALKNKEKGENNNGA